MSQTIIKAKEITKQYKTAKALDNFNICVNKGDIYGLIGANGAGKSTFLKIIAGLNTQTTGEIELFNSKDLVLERKKIGSVIENPSFFKNLSAKENLLFYCKQLGCNSEIIDDCLKKVNLQDTGSKKFKNFSLGMKQRLGLAFALMTNPELIILDEPTNGLDPVGILELRDIIKNLNNEGVTFLICSHILSELSQIATKFGIMDKGKFIKEFSKEELTDMTSDRIVISSSEFDKLKIYLNEKKLPFVEIDNNTVEVENGDLNVHSFATDMVNKEIIIDAIYHKKTSLEDVFFDTITNKEVK